MQQRRAARLHRIDQRLFDPIAVVESLGFPKIDDQVTARIGQSVARDKMILRLQDRLGNDCDGLVGIADAGRPRFFVRRHQLQSSHFGHLPFCKVDTCALALRLPDAI